MTLTLQDTESVAEFLEYLAKLIRKGDIEALSVMMTSDGRGRASIDFHAGVKVPQVLRASDPEPDEDEDDTQPGVPVPRKPTLG